MRIPRFSVFFGALAVVAGALLWTHYWGMFLIGATGLVVLARWW